MTLTLTMIITGHSDSFLTYIIQSLRKIKVKQIVLINGIISSKSKSLLTDYQRSSNDIEVIHSRSVLRYPLAANTLLRRVKTDYVIVLDSDIFVESDELKKLLRFVKDNKEVGGAQGILYYPQNGRVQSGGHLFFEYCDYHAYNMSPSKIQRTKPIKRQALCSGFSIFKYEAIKNVGYFDEFLLHARSGVTLSHKVMLSGFDIYCLPSVSGLHFKSLTRSSTLPLIKKDISYFWSKYGSNLKEDLIPELRSNQNFDLIKWDFVIDCSTIRNTELFLYELFNKSVKVDLKLLDINIPSLNLYEILKYDLAMKKLRILWITTNFTQLENNYDFFSSKERQKDVIIDMSANIVFARDLFRVNI